MSGPREDCLNQWDGLWAAAARVAALDHVHADEAATEPLQLMVGALIYHRMALEAFCDATLHDPVRQDPASLKDLLSLPGAALLEPATAKRAVMGGVHLASASLRLPTAILETIDARPKARAAEGKFDEVRRCRAFEAQRLLISWALNALEQPR